MRNTPWISTYLAICAIATASAFQVSRPTTVTSPLNHPTTTSRGQPLQVLRSDLMYTDIYSVPLLLITALGVGIAAQSFINQMLEGEDGLGAFLSDGSGYNKSGFKKSKSASKEIKKDPLPWLKLPELDFVEVAGQEKLRTEEEVLGKLEILRQDLNEAVETGNLEQAEVIRLELENIMKTYDVEYK